MNPAGTGESKSQAIDKMGGSVELEGTTLTVPAGALPDGQTITVTSSTGPGTSGSAMLNLTPGVHELRADARSMFTGQVASRTISITVY